MKNLEIFFNEVRLNAGAIWLENEAIQFAAPKKFQNQEADDFIVNNKDQITVILKENRILSIDSFFSTIIFKNNLSTFYPLSPAQERLWFIEQYEQGTNAYHIPVVLELDADTDKGGIKYALQQIVSRHEVLRSTIEQGERQEHGIQIVHETPLTIEEITISDEEDCQSLIKEDINRPFDLSAEYPIRVKFYTLPPDKDVTGNGSCRTLLFINMHHIASDGWSIGIFQKELVAYYEAYIKGDRGFKLPALEIQYKDYAAWQKTYLTGEILEKQLSYWKEKLSGYQTLVLPTDYVRPHLVDYRGTCEEFTLNREISKKLRALAQRYGSTLHSVLLSSMNILLGKYTGQEDIITGSPIANRHYRQTEGLIGFFVNTQVNRSLLSKTQSLEDLILQVHQDQIEAQIRQDIPFEKLVDELEIDRDPSRNPIFQVSFVVQSFGSQGKFAKQQKKYLKPYKAGGVYETTKFDLSIYIDDSQEELLGYVNYATSLFHQDTIERFISHYSYLLELLAEAPDKPYSQISLLRPGEYNQIIYQWNETGKACSKDKTIYQLFQEQVEKSPDQIALVYEGQQLTYKELNEKSNQLARCIRKQYQQRTEQELHPDTLIALCLDRSLEMVIGILAVLKAGGAYVPMDTNYPPERLNYILEDTRSELILSQRHLTASSHSQLPKDKVIHIDLAEEIYKEEDTSNLLPYSEYTDLAYVIYTSGTTGKPKGVMVEHHQVSAFALENNFINYEKANVVAGVSNYGFDGSVFDIFFTLINGKKLVLIDNSYLLDLSILDSQLIKYNVETIFITTALFNSLVQNQSGCLDVLQQVLFGGEACNKEIINDFKRRYEKTSLIHVYGPTENIVYSSYCKLSDYDTINTVPIGKHLSDKKLYVLDYNLSPVPIGVIGELYIGGAGVARGYLNRPDLTEERFIRNPFATQAEQENGYTRMYKTGDLVRWLKDGNIEFIGRNDNQVKIRGYRIEIGEIEHALAKIAGIKQSCVLARERKTESGGIKYLAGYYVLDSKYVSSNYSDILDSWENLYNTEYDKDIEEVNRESDFTGWNSYITAEPIPVDEMQQWRDIIVGIIKKLNPGRVLEIGVGSGLLMYPLLGNIERYTGLDISQSVIDRHKNYLKDKKQDVEFYHLRADQVNQLPQEEFYDTIIINSVCQYFPNISYFDDMLDQAMHKLSGAGSIFLGDIRNYDLHKELIKEKLDYAGKNYTQQDIDRIALKENELLISPGYFINLKNRYKNIRVDIYERKGIYVNELSKYRYDVVISVEGKNTINSTNGIGGNDIALRGYSTNNHNIPFLNQLSREDILKQLSTVLPSYLIPDALVVMESFPLTINGKLDKRALPDPDFSSSGEYVAATTETEITMCRIWQSVLGLERVGITDNFFRIGGNSILAIHISHRMSKALGFDVKVADVFKYKTISELLLHSIGQTQLIIPKTETNQALLSFAQERLWFIEQYEQGTNAYHMPGVYELEVDTNKEGIKYALQQIVSRHEVLRSTIEQGDSQEHGMQIVHDAPLAIEEILVADKDDLESLVKEGINRPFDLSTEYPIRVKFYTVHPDKDVTGNGSCRTLLLINMHHIASDGWSIEIFQKELFAYYEAYIKGDKEFKLPALEIQYKDYAVWQRSYLTSEILEKQLSYWKEKLSGYSTLQFPTDYVRPSQIDYRGSNQTFALNKEISKKLRALAQRYGTTLHSVLLSSMNILLSKYTGQEDIIIGSPIANRHYRQTEGLIGFFVNTQVNRTLLSKTQNFEDLIQQVHQDQIEAQLHQDLPFEKIIDELGVERDTSRNPIFQVMFGVQSFGSKSKGTAQQKQYFKSFQAGVDYEAEKFDLTIFINDSQDELIGQLSYATSLFHKETIQRFIAHYTHLLEQLTEAPGKPYSKHSLLSPEEYDQIVYRWNATGKAYPKDKTIYQLFREQAEKTPKAVAIIDGEERILFHELDQLKNKIANYLIKNNCKKGERVAVKLENTKYLIATLLAVKSVACVYIPLDIEAPASRVNYILHNSKSKLLIDEDFLNENLPEIMLQSEKSMHPEESFEGDDYIEFIIYTSGSTGNPKGVKINNKGILNRLNWMWDKYQFRENEVCCIKTSISFVDHIWEIFGPLLKGIPSVIIKKRELLDVRELIEKLSGNEVSRIVLVPSLLTEILNHDASLLSKLGKLNLWTCSGEELRYNLVNKFYETFRSDSKRLLNIYGSTEVTADATYFDTYEGYNNYKKIQLFNNNFSLDRAGIESKISIGKPIDNVSLYILDENLNPVPYNVVGEICISGSCLSSGYIDDPVNQMFFFANPFIAGKKVYKTGDYGRFSSTGQIVYIGRNDDQVKIRGYRIELGEIEHALTGIAGIKQSCVLAKERKTEAGSTKYLVGYYVLDNSAQALTQVSILEELSNTLPGYMLPGVLVAMESFPLTPNGKLDKRALPDPDFSSSEEYVAPATETEIMICRIWQSVLGLERVGVNDNFFRIGGNSILAIQLSHRMSKALHCDVKVADVFRHKALSQLLVHSIGKAQLNIPKSECNQAILSFAQERLWFIEQYEQGTNAYHMPAVLELEVETDIEGIKYALQQIVSRHEVLRSTIEQQDSQEHGIQIVHDKPLAIEEIIVTDGEDYKSLIKEDINRPFDLSAEYPIRVKFYKVQPNKDVTGNESCRTLLLINMHHIASDGWSLEIFQKELFANYETYIKGDGDFKLPALEIQYKDYAVWQRSYLTGEILEKQLNYWKEKLSGYQTLVLPTDYLRPHQVDYRGTYEGFILTEEISKKLRSIAQRYGTTLHSVLLSSMNILLGKYTGQEDIVTGSPIANRHYRQTEELIGFFVNTQVNRSVLNKTQSYADLIQQVHQDQIESQTRQDIPFEKLVDELAIERDVSRHPVFQVSFVVQSFGNQGKFAEQQKKYFKPFQAGSIYEATKFDLSIYIDDSQQVLMGYVNYATSLFHKDTIKRLIQHYSYLLEQLTEAPEKPYSLFSLLRPGEYNQIIYQWNQTSKAYPKDKTVYQLFQEQAEKTPGNIALVYEGQQLTYKELNERSNQLARCIRKQYQQRTKEELKSDTLIALFLDRSLEMVIGILAVLKAGGAYVPMDTNYPQDRLNYILEDTRAELVLSQRDLGEGIQIELPKDKVIYIDLPEELYKEEDTSNLLQHSQATDLAYVIYTSGTTGNPKGVLVEHKGLVNLVFIQKHKLEITSESKVLQYASLVFDASVWEIFSALSFGAELSIIPANLRQEAGLLCDYLANHKITIALLPPVLLSAMPNTPLEDLKTLLVGGDQSSLEIMSRWCLGRKLINAYGPTENTVIATMHVYEEGDLNTNIGKPIDNAGVYVLDGCLNPVPVGVIGELYIGGAGLARGYLNRPDLTEERFIPNSFATSADILKGYTRLYKTGDLVRWLPEGDIEYIGRNDDQVKIRGYRIEIGEIEHALAKIAGIKQSCVLARERKTETGGIKYLAGYYVLDSKYVSSNYSDILDSWENLYNTEYDKDIEDVNRESDFTGWNSYITAEPIPVDEMEQWRDSIVGVIRKLNPGRVLEIGVGSGLLMYPLLGNIERYTGLDISQSVIDRHKNYLEDKKQDVEFYHLRADQVNQLPQEEFYDTIIINSVCQYFPNIRYFDDMLDQAMHKLSGAGSIFLGDIRNYDLHKELIKEKLDYAGENYTQQDLERIALKENELLISPGYFINLKSRYKNIRVDIYERTGIYVNELSKYRYDVVISVEGKNTINSTNGIGGNGIALRGYSTNNHNIPFLNQLSREDILKQLSTVLPSYMIPDALVVMESFPLTINGKLDKRALPDPDFSSSGEYMAPTTETEITMCRIWQSVLGLERVGITDNFFRIGGNSILAIQVSHRMSNVSGRAIKVADIFRQKTISELLLHSIGQTELSIPKTETDPAVLSFAQERLWFIEQYEQGTNAYHMPAVLEMEVDTDKGGIKYALQQIVSRHEVLRSTIEQGDNQEHGIQIIHDVPLAIEEILVADNEDLESLVKEDINRPFDLSAEYPIRVKFYTVQPDKDVTGNESCRTLLLINMHHIASDGWSIEIFQKELFAFYEAYINGDKEFKLPALEIQYKDYAVWQRSYLTGEILEKQLSYWKEKLSGYSTLQFPTDSVRPSQIDYRGSNQTFALNKETSKKLRALAQRHGTTLHSVLLSSMNILLGKYTGQEDIIIGSPIANRHYRQTEGLIGFFVNTQANRTPLNKTQNFEDLIQQVHQDQIEAQLHQDLPFEKLIDELEVERDLSRHPIFQVMFGVQSFGSNSKGTGEQKQYFKAFQAGGIYEVEKFDLTIFINDNQDELIGQISYAISLFHKDTIKRLIQHYTNLLEQLVEKPELPYSQISLLHSEEYNQIIYQWNETDKEYPKDKTIYQLFQEQAEKTPGHIALVYEGEELTYEELNEKSNQLARRIRKQYQQRTKEELKPDTLIALFLERSLEMVIGILAVLKAGGAYVPIDTNYPQERLNYILEDTRADLILSQTDRGEGMQRVLPQDKLIYIDMAEELYKEEDSSNLPQHSKATDLAYVIYTSGTTGKPKGVMLNHSGIVNRLEWMQSMYSLDSEDVVLQKTPYVFDVSVWEILWANWYGAKIVIAKPEGHKDSEYLDQLIMENGVTTLHFVPAMLDAYNFYLQEQQIKLHSTIRQIFCSGEALHKNTVQQTYKNSVNETFRLHNLYGPTEASIDVTYFETSPNANVYIGRPIQNSQTYILDANYNPVPIGIIGELYIGGAGLARGYLNRPDLTEERFIPNPFATSAAILKGYTRLYKTGDLVRWLPGGNLEFIGRNDDQVKIHGYRIELGEIQHALSKIAGIKQSYILAKERKTEAGATKYLVGYYVLDNSAETFTQAVILEELSKTLPEYIVPSVLVAMQSFPLTINGKLDKQALPAPDFKDSENFIQPETELENRLCQIYAEILGLNSDQISTHQNFFRMGGNSILSIQLKQKLNQLDEFRQISLAELFKYNTINKLVESLQQEKQTVYNLQNNKYQSENHEVAIIGISGAFSGVNSIGEFWNLIANQQEGIQFYSKEECKQLGIDEAFSEDPNYIPVGGKVKDIELFDPLFWEMSPNEAKQLDPQIRKFIEHCWFALESSGYSNQRKGHHIGVFAGSGTSDYFYEHILHGENAEQINMWEASNSNSKDALATKTAFLLGLSGPANSINTTCSTGLVSVVEACKNLQIGTCNMALAGGVSLSMPDKVGYLYQEDMITSKDGHCRTFDSEASGTTGGSGVGVVLLKRLDDAIKDKDIILGVIKGYATNNDGDRKTGYTAPSVIGQSECIINAQKMAGITSDQIDYVECHGTATRIGDPIEVQALREAFAYTQSVKNRSKQKTILGAVKANIGHADSAAGTAGLIKVVAMLQHNIIPGQINFNQPNPELHLDQTNFEISKENRDWLPDPARQRLAGVSSFGIGGTNAHVIIGDYFVETQDPDTIRVIGFGSKEKQGNLSRYIIPISAKNRQSLERYKQALIAHLTEAKENNSSLSIRDITYTLQEKREHFQHRSAYCATNIEELMDKLGIDTPYDQANTEGNNKIVFMFPGQGAQYTSMAKALYENQAFFKNTIDQCIKLANQHLAVDLYEVLYPGKEASLYDINETRWTQISLFIIEYSLAKFLEHLGVHADAYMGHSIGEYVAATLSGVFNLEDAIKIVITRGRLMQSMDPGIMLAINAREEAIREITEAHACEIAVINSMEDIVVSGQEKDIKSLQEALNKQNIPTVILITSHAYHSRLMEGAASNFESVFKNIKLHKPLKVFASNVSGEIAKEEVTKASYWCKQLRNTVQFAKGIDSLSKQYNHKVSFIEVGTGKGLSYFVNRYKNANNYKSINTLQLLPSAKEAKAVEEQLFQHTGNKEDIKAKLWMSGIIRNPNETNLFTQARLHTGLPLYQFNHQKCLIEKNKVNRSNNQINLLPEEKWLSVPVWSAAYKLNRHQGRAIFKNALIFIREDQLSAFDFTTLAQDIQFIILDPHNSNIDDAEAAKLIRINPDNEHHFKMLAAHIKTKQIVFDTIIHSVSINNVPEIDTALCYSFYSLFLVRQHLLNNSDVENLLVLTNGLTQITNEDFILPSNGTLVAAIRNINHEFPHIDARIVDVGYDQKNIVPDLVQIWNIESCKKSEELLAIRFGRLWIERYEKINHTLVEERTIADGDIILITGGLGRVALSVAKHISGKLHVTFILVSRKNIYEDKNLSDQTKEKIDIIETIKANGSSVDIRCADISDPAQVNTLIDNVKASHGNITGIIHTAGVLPLGMEDYSIENVKKSFKGKVYGIENVINSLNLLHVNFIVSTSSLASIMGDVSRVEYCASNGYLDYLAADRKRFKDCKIISVNWNGWTDIGMVREQLAGEKPGIAVGKSINPIPEIYRIMSLNSDNYDKNAGLFYSILNQNNYVQVAVSKFDLNELKSHLFFKTDKPGLPGNSIMIVEDRYTETEYQIAQIFGDILGLEQVSIHDDFFRIGGNSILAVQVSHRMSKALSCDVKVSDVFKLKSINMLSKNNNLFKLGNDTIRKEF